MVPLDDIVEPVWDWFVEIAARKSSNGFGPGALTWVDLDAWQRLRRIRLSGGELDLILELDGIFLEDYAEQQRRQRDDKKPRRK